jgi:hypothetical protein
MYLNINCIYCPLANDFATKHMAMAMANKYAGCIVTDAFDNTLFFFCPTMFGVS